MNVNKIKFFGPVITQVKVSGYDEYMGLALFVTPTLSVGFNNPYLWFGVGFEWLIFGVNIGFSKKSFRETWAKAQRQLKAAETFVKTINEERPVSKGLRFAKPVKVETDGGKYGPN